MQKRGEMLNFFFLFCFCQNCLKGSLSESDIHNLDEISTKR
jgi:hypothetical protein